MLRAVLQCSFLVGAAAVLSGVTLAAAGAPEDRLPPLKSARVSQIESALASRGSPASPTFFTPPFSQRSFWDAWARILPMDKILADADSAAKQAPPNLTEALFNEFAKTGRRDGYEKPFGQRLSRLALFTYAEGLQNKRRYLAAIEREITAILDEPSWASPAHAFGRKTWRDNHDNIDLAAAARAWGLGTVNYLLDARLSAALRSRIRSEVRTRVLRPYLSRIRTADRQGFWWMNATNNWNAVCNGGVAGAALLLSDNRKEQAEVVAAFEAYTQFFLQGLGDDGFCHEGLGYWLYGFGHYTVASELIRIATNDRLDLMEGEKQKLVATFDSRWELVPGIYPPFGDAGINSRTAPWLHDFATLRYKRPDVILGQPSRMGVVHGHPLGAHIYLTAFDLSTPRPGTPPSRQAPGSKIAASYVKPSSAAIALPIRDWFPDSGALIARSNPVTRGLAVALKGGNNDQPHNHNDLGSYVIAYKGQVVLTDLGSDDYVKDTFSAKRYTSGLMNSFGHPVPRVAGKLQKTGVSARAVTVRSEFSDSRDMWEIDLTSAYEVPELKRLTRTFIFNRSGETRLEIIDHALFSSPQAFETALVLQPRQKAEQVNSSLLRVRADRAALNIALAHQGGGGLVLKEEPIYGIIPNRPPKGTRLEIAAKEPAKEVTIHLTFTGTAGF